ncbi:hypothetical protein JX265_009410 [Neoarthrinium moseri]|uniref:Glycoside hydrolase n=1 Tax=Neoarthrinium moseri TaxID=1658444 RepID=A0A9Q0AMS3_9PEZI|nr:hypothetical protein JX266_011978 [Neoarthrinium moseri]KAI1861907.1 hypothetical protein JX265_009410 [Neoarthrinium moseri]
MPGINQLPSGCEGFAAFALIYSSISWICSALLIWCAQLYREAWSFQQSHDITSYREILAGQFYRKTTFLENPELAIANGSYGLDLVLYYIQYYSYNVEAMLVMFWAFELAQSVYGLSANPKLKPILRKINAVGKAFSILFPLLTILMLRASAIQRVFVVFILLADLPLMLSLAIGSITMIAILARYVQSRKRFSNWTQGNSSADSNDTSMETALSSTTGRTGSPIKPQQKRTFYDRWLMVRFTVAFVILAVFEVTNTLFQLQSVNNNRKDSTLTEPDYSLDRAKTTFMLFLPGVTPGIFLFVVFGTTAGCRAAVKDIFARESCENKGDTPSWPRKRRDAQAGVGRASQDQFTRTSEGDWNEGTMAKEEISTFQLPVASLVSKYNMSFNASHDAEIPPSLPPSRQSFRYSYSSRFSRAEKSTVDNTDMIQLRSISSLDQIREDYYQHSPEQSDDSGPILPIMSPQDQKMPRTQSCLTTPAPAARLNPSAK